MTNGWNDIQNADVILAMGGNPAENHPVGFRWVMEARRNRNAKLVAVDPRFQRTAAVADAFVQIRVGTDIAFLGGVINYALSTGRYQADYVKLYTNAPFLVREDYSFNEADGLFSGWNAEKQTYDRSSWNYELDDQKFAKVDPTLEHPRSVFQLMKKHYARYTPEEVSRICGCSVEDFHKAAELITSTYLPDKVGTIMYALGWTHHSFSVQLIHTGAMLQLLLGNIGMAGGGMNALRGHANIQGGTDCGVAYHNLPGYIAMPKGDHPALAKFIDAVTPKPLRPHSMNFWSNTDRFVVSQLKAYYGHAATKENEFGYLWHPKLPQTAGGGYENWSWAYIFDAMYSGKLEGFFDFGMNPVANGAPFHITIEPPTKPVPVTVSWNAGPPATAEGGFKPEMTGAGGTLMLKMSGSVALPPGLVTRTKELPAEATSVEEIKAVNCVELLKVVGRLDPLQTTVEPLTKLVPVTTRLKAAAPAATLAGANVVAVGPLTWNVAPEEEKLPLTTTT